MNGTQVDLFSKRLTHEMEALSWKDRSDLLVRIGHMFSRMHQAGQTTPLWRGPAAVADMLGATVVADTEQGERRGRVIGFGIMQMPDGIEYERSLVVLVPSSGTHHEVPASSTRLACQDDVERIQGELEMARKMKEAGEAMQRGVERPPEPKTRKRGEKDPALLAKMLDAARSHPNVVDVVDGSSNYKIVGRDPDKRIYLFKTQLRCDVAGVVVDHPGIRKISEQEAKDMHLGKVRGQVDFHDKQAAYGGFIAALELLK